MAWENLERTPIEGKFNRLFFVTNETGVPFLKRVPKDNPTLLKQIQAEYEGVMFLPLGGNFRKRTLEEQFSFSIKAAGLGLKVLPPSAIDREAIYYPFLDQVKSMKEYFSSKDARVSFVVNQLVNDLRRAHGFNVIYGDRWLPNILVKPEHKIVHIDFDIEISGKWAREFEVSQIIYYTILAGGKPALTALIGSFQKDLFLKHQRNFSKIPSTAGSIN